MIVPAIIGSIAFAPGGVLHSQNRPDLRPIRVSGPSTTTIGSPLSMTVAITNQGTGAAPAGWTGQIVLSSDAVISQQDVHIGAGQVRVPLPPRGKMDVTVRVTIPAGLRPGVYYYGVILDATGAIAESNEQNNTAASSGTVTVGGPDLAPLAASGPSALDAGQEGQFSFTVTNRGQTVARTGCPLFDTAAIEAMLRGEEPHWTPCGWYAQVFLSLDPNISQSDLLIGAVNERTDLVPGATTVYTPRLHVPLAAPTGSYYLGVIVDATGTVREFDETNNALSTTGLIPVTGHPDLAPTGLDYVGMLVGLPTTVAFTVKNEGALPVPAGWQGSIFLSQTRTTQFPHAGTAVIVPLGSYTETSAISPGSQVSRTQQVVIPPTYTSSGNTILPSGNTIPLVGSWFLSVTLDGQNAVNEGSERNNRDSMAVTIAPPPDLVPIIISGPATADVGSQVTLTIQVANSGLGYVPNGWSAAIYLVGSAGAVLVERFTETAVYGALSSVVSSRTLSLPATMTPGSYTWRFVADEGNNAFEFNNYGTAESNNTLDGSSVQILSAVDLVPTTVGGPASVIQGDVIPVTWSVANRGGGSDPATWIARLVLSTDNTIDAGDATLGDFPQAPVAAGAVAQGSATVRVTSAPRTYYLGLVADPTLAVIERDETNNVFVGGATITVLPPPDLVPTTVGGPNQVQAGNGITITTTVSNQGPGSAPGGWVRQIYLSTDPTISTADVLLAAFTDQTTIASGGSSTAQDGVTVPASTPRGDYYLGVILVPPYPETSTANNVLGSTAKLRVR